MGVGREGEVAVDEENVGVGDSGSMSSRFLGRRVERKILFRPARLRLVSGGGKVGDVGASRIGDKLICGDSGD